jgi:hypothetical protein
MKKWSEEDVALLRNYYPSKGSDYCANLLNRTERATAKKAYELGIRRDINYWAEEEIDFLKENYTIKPLKEVASHLKRTEASVQTKANRLGIRTFERTEWTHLEDKVILDNFKNLPLTKIAELLGRSYESVQHRSLKVLGLSKFRWKEWTEGDITFLKENYPNKLGHYCAKKLNRSFYAVHKMVEKLGIKPNWTYEYINKQGYKVLTFNRNNKILAHRFVMENHIGRKLTSEEVIHHIDKDKLNNDISNLTIMNRSSHAKLHMDERNNKNKI